MIHGRQADERWDEFQQHIADCAQCCDVAQPMCAEGKKLERLWGQADAVAQRMEQEADSLQDCADDARPWGDDHADDWRPGMRE